MISSVEKAVTLLDSQKRVIKQVLDPIKKHGLIFLRLDLLSTVEGQVLRVTCRNKTGFPSAAAVVSTLRQAGIDGELDYRTRLGMTGRTYWCYCVTQKPNVDSVKAITVDEQFSTLYILLG